MTVQALDRGRIDVQFHFSPAFYTERVQRAGGHITTDRWSVEAALEYMDANRVAAGVMSVSSPGVNFVEPAESVVLARALNEAAAKVAHDHPGRFGNFATLPMLDVVATLAEIDYCLDELDMDGVAMMSNVGGTYLGHESFAPIFEELNRRGSVVFVHPTDPSYGQVEMAPVAEWPFDTTRAAIDLMYSGTMRRCPNVSVILAHAGGALPMVATRVQSMSPFYSSDEPRSSVADTVEQVAGFYYDLAISAHANVIGALRDVSSLEQVLFACDWPFAPDMAVRHNVAGFESLDLTPDERYAIERGNAARLFPRLLAKQSPVQR